MKAKEASMPRVLTYALVLVGGALAVLKPGAAEAVDEYVMSRIECPASTHLKLNWTNKIGADPTFSLIDDGQVLQALFAQMSQNGQRILCHYRHGYQSSNYQSNAYYHYEVKRKIISCAHPNPRVLECKLKK